MRPGPAHSGPRLAAAEPIELGDLIDRRPMSATQLLVAIVCAGALFIDGYDIQVMALAVPSLAREWSLPVENFGWALAAVVVGITVGAAVLGPLADWLGRKTMLVAAMVTIGIATTCTALATTTAEFVIWRLLTGAALGAGLPSCAALTSEYAPAARRSMVVGLMNITSPMGAFSAGFLAPPVLAALGWRGTFVIGGIAPLAIGLLAILFVPESLKFLIIRRPGDARIGRILRRIAPEVDPATVRATPPARAKGGWVLGPEFRTRTLLLWAILILNMFILYLLVSYLPVLLQRAGWGMDNSLRGGVLNQGGGIFGGLLMSTFLYRGAARAGLATAFCLSALCLLSFVVVPSGAGWVVLLLFLGAGVSGAQLVLIALAAGYYPPAFKATGVSWALLIGGIGSTLGPLGGAWLIAQGLSTVAILALTAIPALICALSVGLMRREWLAH